MLLAVDGFDFLIQRHTNEAWREIPVVVVRAKVLTSEVDILLSVRVEQVPH